MAYGRNNSILGIIHGELAATPEDSRNRDFPFPVHPPVNSLFRSSEKRSFLAKPPHIRDLSKEGWIIEEKFPVFFPVSKEFRAENSSRATASTASRPRVSLSTGRYGGNRDFPAELAEFTKAIALSLLPIRKRARFSPNLLAR
jgi:hypothetical protein